jgi:hypothetical protein
MVPDQTSISIPALHRPTRHPGGRVYQHDLGRPVGADGQASSTKAERQAGDSKAAA